ncbi:ORF106 [Agrotis segetum granulovirus]|uniref:Iap-2 n=1 Tax=Agrotis segetum granulosis virus TaxID=10464 RepID=Q6QXG6_GVAS|nr:iap-2 [Agrotis segetum granulovirus]AAS82632.1 ORF106 [Agrotis segetum granulovirus]AHN92156.1 iap-5 [Agrotis segetum granulovirus]AKN63394.1 iap-2 [Agrotis segetum granulovirus]
MNSYETRLKTFDQWQGREDKARLASLGFYYTGQSDRVICAFCKLDLYNFSKNTNALYDHKRYSPHCPFIFGQCNPGNYFNTSFISPRVVSSNYPNLAIDTAHHSYNLLEHRSLSFKNYPKCLKHLVYRMCLAGLYYTNVGDCVSCYACGVIIKDWAPDDDPSKRHQASNSLCSINRCADTLCVNSTQEKNVEENQQSNFKASAPALEDLHYTPNHYKIPFCLLCKCNEIDCVLLPCYHFCACSECSPTCLECPACHVTCTGFFLVKIPKPQLDSVCVSNGGKS